MNPILSAGVLIGVLCGLCTFVMGVLVRDIDPLRYQQVFIVVVMAIEIAGLIWGLRRTAREGRGYASQVVAGTMMSVIAGVIIIAASLLCTMVVFPHYYVEQEATYRRLLTQAGQSEAQIAQAIAANLAGATPMNQAMAGFIGTLVTGIVGSALIAIWIRAKPGGVGSHA